MVIVQPEPSALDSQLLTLFFTKDPLLGNLPFVIFHGPSTTTNSTLNTSRIQAHIFSVAGYQSFPRLTISPTSPLYSAVHQLPAEDQGDEISRGLAISLFKYFAEIPEPIQECLRNSIIKQQPGNAHSTLFDAGHAARLASQMERVENSDQIITHLLTALRTRSLSWTDIDLVLPPNSVSTNKHNAVASTEERDPSNLDNLVDYGKFTEIINLFGSPSFLPTSKLKRAPSKPTGGNRLRILSGDQITAIKMDLQEVLETERNYVSKISDLANEVAPQWNQDIASLSSDYNKAVAGLFPPSLSQILDTNTHFLARLQRLFEDDDTFSTDPTGTNAFAKLLLDILPQLQQPYIEYIRASNSFFAILSDFSRDGTSRFFQQLQQTGEQRLRSWLIEPIQRLPRYILFIESMLKKLPVDHPAIPKLLRAKDLIGEILDAEELDVDNDMKTLKRLRSLVLDWPSTLTPGHFITAADVIELNPPFTYTARLKDEPQGILLLFPDYVLVFNKTAANALSARGLIAELDRATAGYHQQASLSLTHIMKLDETRFLEAEDGKLLYLASAPKSSSSLPSKLVNPSAIIQVYALLGSYEGKAARWNEEVARARVEARFPETLREDERWGLKTLSPDKTNLGLVAAVFDDSIDTYSDVRRTSHGRIRVVLQDGESSEVFDQNLDGVEIFVQIAIVGPSKYRVEFRESGQQISVDKVYSDDLMAVFLRRMNNLQRTRHQPINAIMAHIHVLLNRKVVETIQPTLPGQPELRNSRFRPMSPVKVLSNFLGGIRDQTSMNKMPTLERSNSKQSLRSIKDIKPGFNLGFSSAFEPAKSMPVAKLSDNIVEGAFVQLEKTLDTYIVAIHSRCGNVVGKVIRNRANADELMVNELYNVLLEDPTQYQATAEVPVDVLFAAFEMFLNRAWREKMGPLLPEQILMKFESMFNLQSSSQLEASFKALLQEMTPQNRRAFSAIVKLLYDLLDASGNDGDRGAITAAVAEALFQKTDHQKYIPLLDRMIDNLDILFDDVARPEDKPTSQVNSMGRRVKATTPGSISSTTSSFKKRFGFGSLSRENSKNESESRVGQILRNLSKKAAGESTSQPSSLSKAFLSRSKSIDDDTRRPFFGRPTSSASKDTPTISRPTSSRQETPDVVAPIPNLAIKQSQMAKKKRRSSLSDITSLQNGPRPDFSSIARLQPKDTVADSVVPLQDIRRALKTPSPVRVERSPDRPTPQVDSTSKIPSPIASRKIASPSPTRKENIPPVSIEERTSSKPRILNTSSGLASPRKRDLNSTQTPSLKPGVPNSQVRSPQRSVLSPPAVVSPRRKISGSPERITNDVPLHRISSGSPQRKSSGATQRLRMQSPQKLRERLEREKKAIDEAGPSLQTELTKIGEELASSLHSPKEFRNRLNTLEAKLNTTLADLVKRNTSVQSDIESSLIVSEKKAKSLDESYREANAENELLYDKFNGELIRVLESVKSGAGLQEMKTKLKEAQDEAARLRKENQRLKRENLGLRSQLR